MVNDGNDNWQWRSEFANWKLAIEIVSFPIEMVMFYSYSSLPEGIPQLEIYRSKSPNATFSKPGEFQDAFQPKMSITMPGFLVLRWDQKTGLEPNSAAR